MKNLIRSAVSIFLFASFFFNSLPRIYACGPFTLEPLFSLTKHADYPLLEYTNGKTGVVPASYGRMSLYVFYRQLNDLSLTGEEQKQTVAALNNDIGVSLEDNEDSANKNEPTAETPDYFAEWLAARAKVTGEKTNIETQKKIPDDYNYFLNCLPDSFRNATKTLEARISKYGNDDNLKEWLKGQDAVFSNCEQARTLPVSLSEKFPEWLRKDRDYQIAAALFYMGNFSAANENFEKIASDENSDWKNAAKFVVARTYIRQASFVSESESEKEKAEKEKSEFLQKASLQLQNILADNSMSDFHKSAYRLLGLVKYRLIPQERKKELAEILVRPAENANLYNDLIDYSWLLDYSQSQAIERGQEFERKQAETEGKEYSYNYKLKLRDVPPEERQNDLTDWLFTFQAEDGFTHAFEKWKETGKLQWLVASVIHTETTTPQAAEILSAADKVQPNSAAFASVRFHQIRLLIEMGKRAQAKQKLDEIFSNNFKDLPLSSQNKFLAQRMSLAENLDEFLKYAQRKAVIFLWSDDGSEAGTITKNDKQFGDWANRTMFDADSAELFNTKIPLLVLRQAALNPQLPPHLRKFLVIAVWTRAFVLGNSSIEREFTPSMSRYAKEFSAYFSKYANASNAANREAAALIAVLRYPVIQPFVPVGFGRDTDLADSIDSNRGNWWCAEYEYSSNYFFSSEDESKRKKPMSPEFLTQAQISAAENENRQMKALGNAATFLARRAVEFATRNPNHPQTPEILHLAVRSTRYGCTDEQTGKFSKQAFDILHQRYPNSVWTKKTPFWFGE